MMVGMPDQKPTLDYARPRRRLPADVGRIGWIIAAFIFMLMCCALAWMILYN